MAEENKPPTHSNFSQQNSCCLQSSANQASSQLQHQIVMFSFPVRQALDKLNVRLVDLVEQINVVVKVLVEATGVLPTKSVGYVIMSNIKSNEKHILNIKC